MKLPLLHYNHYNIWNPISHNRMLYSDSLKIRSSLVPVKCQNAKLGTYRWQLRERTRISLGCVIADPASGRRHLQSACRYTSRYIIIMMSYSWRSFSNSYRRKVHGRTVRSAREKTTRRISVSSGRRAVAALQLPT